MISEEIIQKVKEENDIVDVISESVKLKRSGRNYFGLCPFHHEKTPSFSVAQDKQIYKCFGCGEAGNVITFVMKTRNISYVEAIELLARRANIEIIYDNEKKNLERSINDRYYKLNIEAARFYYRNLLKSKKAITYLTNRGISSETIRRFGLGFAEDSWNSTMNFLMKKGFTNLDFINNGLVIKSQKGTYYDRFRNRVIFPIFDINGRVIGFGGRVMDDSKPKYLNSPETKIFKKGTNLYGLNFAVKNGIKDRSIIMVEGYMDCISLHQHGITNVVASLGTALTPGMAKLMKRYADKIILSYDSDSAGMNAAMRGLEILKKEGLDVRILTVPEGKDPDEYIRKNSKESFLMLVEKALLLTDYKLKMARRGYDLKKSLDAAEYAKNAIDIIKELDPVERDVYINKLSADTGVKEIALYDLMNEKLQKNVKNAYVMNIDDTLGQKLYLEPAYLSAERNLIKIMSINSKAYDYIINNFNIDNLILDSHKKIYNLIEKYIQDNLDSRIEHIGASCDDLDSSKEWVIINDINVILDEDDYKDYIDACIKELKKYQLEESKKQIMTEIKLLENQGKITESLELTQKLTKIQKEIGGI